MKKAGRLAHNKDPYLSQGTSFMTMVPFLFQWGHQVEPTVNHGSFKSLTSEALALTTVGQRVLSHISMEKITNPPLPSPNKLLSLKELRFLVETIHRSTGSNSHFWFLWEVVVCSFLLPLGDRTRLLNI